MVASLQIVFDCANPDRLARFWAEALDYQLQPPPTGFSTWEDWLRDAQIPEEEWNSASAIVDPDGGKPRVYFQRVPESKQVKNRVHIDINAAPRGTPADERRKRVQERVDKLVSAGATVVSDHDERGEHWVVMQDPEGNEFCVQ